MLGLLIFMWVFTGVYGSMTKGGREQLWKDLGAIRCLWEGPWCIGADFNVIRFPVERNKENKISRFMKGFSQIIDELELKDLPLQGGSLHLKRRLE